MLVLKSNKILYYNKISFLLSTSKFYLLVLLLQNVDIICIFFCNLVQKTQFGYATDIFSDKNKTRLLFIWQVELITIVPSGWNHLIQTHLPLNMANQCEVILSFLLHPCLFPQSLCCEAHPIHLPSP